MTEQHKLGNCCEHEYTQPDIHNYSEVTLEAQKLIKKVIFYNKHMPELLHGDELDWLDVLQYGLKKGYDANNWCEPDGKRCSRKENFDSINHHVASTFLGHLKDDGPNGSGLYHSLHAMCRNYFSYHRDVNNIVHPDDEVQS